MRKVNRTCLVCGAQYEYCPVCGAVKSPTWMTMFEGENCKTIFTVCSDFNGGIMTAVEAQEALKEVDLSNRESFADDVKNTLKKIFAVKEVTVTADESKKPYADDKKPAYQDNRFPKKFEKNNK